MGDAEISPLLLEAAQATCDFYIEQATAADGIPYWDTGAPNLHRLGDWQSRPAEPFNPYEPVDSSAAAIAAQGLLRLGRYLKNERYWQAGLTVLDALFDEPYLSVDPKHQGLILHSIYHRPNGWDYVPAGSRDPLRRVEHVGRLPRPGSRALRPTPLRKQTVFDLLGRISMIIADLAKIEGRRYPARRRTQNVVGGVSPIQAAHFSIGNVVLDPNGGQVPWHNQEQEEVYFIIEGTGEMCLGDERQVVMARPSGLYSARSLPPTHQHRRHAAADALLLRSGGRRGPLETGTERHAARRRSRCAAAAARGMAAMHGKTQRTDKQRNHHIARQSMSIHTHSVGIIMNGVTGRMGTNQHLMRSIVAIIKQGGVKVGDVGSHHARPDSGRPQSG